MYLKGAGGERPEELLLQSKTPGWDEHWPTDWSSKGIVFESGNRGNTDIWILPVDGDRKPYPVFQEPGVETQPKVSPDAKWLAYVKRDGTERGGEVYVASLSTPRAKWRVSTAGGRWPQWRIDGKELFYVAADGNVMAVPIEPDTTTFGAPVPKILFQTGRQGPGGDRVFGVSPDGQRFLLVADDQPNTASIVVVMNWPELLKPY
jgi:hypothetical protein